MERAAVRRRLTWQVARVVELVPENARTTSLVDRVSAVGGRLIVDHDSLRAEIPCA
jgi:hypothetical protein